MDADGETRRPDEILRQLEPFDEEGVGRGKAQGGEACRNLVVVLRTAEDVVELTGCGLSAEAVVAVARYDAAVRLTRAAGDLMAASAAIVQRALHGAEPAYGVSTGFGSLANVVIAPERREQLQRGCDTIDDERAAAEQRLHGALVA